MTLRQSALALLLGVGLSSCVAAATLTVHGTISPMGNAGDCDSVVSVPLGEEFAWFHVVWSGPTVVRADTLVRVGDLFGISRQVPPGAYTVVGWAEGVGGLSCSTVFPDTAFAPPKAPILMRRTTPRPR